MSTGEPAVLFVNGFHRSGTTLLTSAVTEAVGGVTTTVGHLARHIPTLDAFMTALAAQNGSAQGGADRGVDRLQVTLATAEEYGFLLQKKTGKQALYGHQDNLTHLREHVDELAEESPSGVVVLKNPWETGRERRLLADFPQARVILLRRRVADIERSMASALTHAEGSRGYGQALTGDRSSNPRVDRTLASPRRRRILLALIRLVLRRRIRRLLRTVRSLPPDRVAFVTYDELRGDPATGAAWAAHLLDPDALAKAFTRQAFTETKEPAPSGRMADALDRRWGKAWDRARAAQVRAGVLAPPTATDNGEGFKS